MLAQGQRGATGTEFKRKNLVLSLTQFCAFVLNSVWPHRFVATRVDVSETWWVVEYCIDC